MDSDAEARREQLRTITETAEQLDAEKSPAVSDKQLRSALEQLRDALEHVLREDSEQVASDDALRQLVVRARSAHAAITKSLKPEPAKAQPTTPEERRQARLRELQLRRCPECDGGVFYLKEAVLHGAEDAVLSKLFAVLCAQCGDVRFKANNVLLSRMPFEKTWERIELPGTPPYRR